MRSLTATHSGWLNTGRLRITVVDNHSSDEGLAELKAACRELNAGFRLSRWPAAESTVNSHGDVLRDFVVDHPGATHFLFVDADVCFTAEDCVGVMHDELSARPDVWAVQARFAWLEKHGGPGSSHDIWAGRRQQLRVEIDGAVAGPFPGGHKARCHPAVALVANTPVFRRVADVIGLSAGVIIAADQSIAGFADTLGPATLAMTTHNLRHVLSEVTVEHYHGVSYDDPTQPIGGKLDDCRGRLAELRSAWRHRHSL